MIRGRKKMKQSIMLVFLAVLTISFAQSTFAKPVWIPLDYNSDGVYDCKYQVNDHYSKERGHFITVVYRDFSCIYLGEEVWVEGSGIVKDTFEPWTYAFPA